MKRGDRLTLRVEKPVAGGRMIARHDGAIVLVSGAIPGELVDVEIEKVQRGTAWARTVHVSEPSTDRVSAEDDWACGGNVLSHVRYARQTDLKRQIIEDALRRIGRIDPPAIEVTPSPIDGYRMRARLHVIDGRIGFFREGTHELCDAGPTRQLLPSSVTALQQLEQALTSRGLTGVAEVELSENCAADERAIHLVLRPDGDPSRLGSLSTVPGVTGLSCGTQEGSRALALWGTPHVTDRLRVAGAAGDLEVAISRHAHAFFQGNRFLLVPLVTAVSGAVPAGRVLDLYAGVGLFAAALGARGNVQVVAIEGDPASVHDLKVNAARARGAVEAVHQSVETFVSSRPRVFDTIIVDPPRTGMTKEALAGALRLRARRLVYVSCDVATFARDARAIVDAGYRLAALRGFDLFPNTAHVETLAVFDGATVQ
jgi:tRNA/tmRNA/rRNA uracil-C5-methylase (TrmA/RlmC/RlmD family)